MRERSLMPLLLLLRRDPARSPSAGERQVERHRTDGDLVAVDGARRHQRLLDARPREPPLQVRDAFGVVHVGHDDHPLHGAAGHGERVLAGPRRPARSRPASGSKAMTTSGAPSSARSAATRKLVDQLADREGQRVHALTGERPRRRSRAAPALAAQSASLRRPLACALGVDLVADHDLRAVGELGGVRGAARGR